MSPSQISVFSQVVSFQYHSIFDLNNGLFKILLFAISVVSSQIRENVLMLGFLIWTHYCSCYKLLSSLLKMGVFGQLR